MKYKLKNGAVKGVSAQTVGETLTAMHAKHGKLTAAAVVDDSRPEDAPLHPAFEWRDSVAGEAWRHHQARNLIKRVTVVDDAEDKDQRPRQVYVHVPDERAYQPVSVVVQQPDMYLSALAQLMRKVQEASAAVDDLKAAARGGKQPPDRLQAVEIAAVALQTAKEALASLH